MLKNIVCAFFILSLVACQESTQIEQLNANSFKEMIENNDVQLVDVRTPEEFALGAIKGAELITVDDDFIKKANSILDKNKPVYVYCKAGGRSNKAADLLAADGYKKIYDLLGGVMSWQENGYDLVKK
ncbi:rhodanese-like domain-containing protein [Flavobacteriaceae bacterium F08102]|nr:rhodanese-like domain-containing protein [Flavobacteriaceae bacterium F08102]